MLQQEELLWFQKSRAKWMLDGDRNTKYYHLKAITRRNRNKILMLRNSEGAWVEEDVHIKAMVNSYYQALFVRDFQN